jgi:signal peptidase II
VLPLYLLDQGTKYWITKNLAPFDERDVSPWFSFCYWMNTEAAFSMGPFRRGEWNNRGFIALSVIALLGIVWYYRRGAFSDRFSRWAVLFLLSGILGNLTDRLLRGHVVDFLLFNFGFRPFAPWPAFNVADSCIFIAVALFIIDAFTSKKSAATP